VHPVGFFFEVRIPPQQPRRSVVRDAGRMGGGQSRCPGQRARARRARARRRSRGTRTGARRPAPIGARSARFRPAPPVPPGCARIVRKAARAGSAARHARDRRPAPAPTPVRHRRTAGRGTRPVHGPRARARRAIGSGRRSDRSGRDRAHRAPTIRPTFRNTPPSGARTIRRIRRRDRD
jgi:hypothetical protein